MDTAPPKPTPKCPARRHRLSRSAIVLIAVAVFAILLSLIFTALLTRRVNDFKSASDYAFAEQVLSETTTEAFYNTLRPFVETHLTVYESGDTVKAALLRHIAAAHITFSRADTYTSEAPVYTVYLDSKEVFLLTLKGKKTLSGYPQWTVQGLEVSPRCELGNETSIEVPHGAMLTVNGHELLPIDAEKAPYQGLSEFEQSLSESIYCDRYTLGRLFLTPEISAVLNSYRLRAESVKDGTFRYGYPSSRTKSIAITVPYGAIITVNGVSVGTRYLVETGCAYPYLTRFESDIPNLITASVYQIPFLFEEPTVTVIRDGEVLTADSDYVYRLPAQDTKTAVIVAPSYATVRINGISLAQSEITKENLDLPIGEGVTGFAMDRPRMVEYTVSGLLTDPLITATDASGLSLTPSPYYSDDTRLLFACTPGGTVPDREQLTLRTFAKLYLQFVYSATNGQSTNYRNCTDMTPSSSLAYQTLRSTIYTLYDAPVHRNIKFGTIEYLGYYPYSKTSYSAILRVPFSSTLNGEKLNHVVTMEILYIYSGSIRRIVNYKVLETVTTTA